MKNIVALQGVPQRDWSKDERAVYDTLKESGGTLSAVGLSRWIKKNSDIVKADAKIFAAAESLWNAGYIFKDVDDNYSIN
jgi:hypothetical protein